MPGEPWSPSQTFSCSSAASALDQACQDSHKREVYFTIKFDLHHFFLFSAMCCFGWSSSTAIPIHLCLEWPKLLGEIHRWHKTGNFTPMWLRLSIPNHKFKFMKFDSFTCVECAVYICLLFFISLYRPNQSNIVENQFIIFINIVQYCIYRYLQTGIWPFFRRWTCFKCNFFFFLLTVFSILI